MLTSIQFLEEFIYQTGRDETDLAKRAKIDALVLRPEEWKRVDALIEILSVHISRDNFINSHMRIPLRCILLSPLLKRFTLFGPTMLSKKNMSLLNPPLPQALQKLKIITRRHLHLMRIPSLCVRAMIFILNPVVTIRNTVLDPDTKMDHFKKHWSVALQKCVLDAAEATVSYLISN